MKKLVTVLASVLLCAFSFSHLSSQSISGTINQYGQVTNIAGANITLTSAAAFSAGDRILLIQMKGATIVQTNNVNYGNITSYGNAGNYEFATVASIAGNTLTLTNSLCQTYDVAGFVQVVRVPQYTNPTVSATLTGQAWNGNTGGVIVLEASGTLTLNADINASGIGFRGGGFGQGGFNCGDVNYFSAPGLGGEKGEGIRQHIPGQFCSRGKLANGGGGSNRGNSGGGGGGNGGSGGLGGAIYSGCGASTIQGIGGLNLAQVNGKAFLGGGGGGGFRDNGQAVTSGAPGGGIVIIVANSVSGNGNFIRSNGNSVTAITNDEGAGAGGAGGSVLLFSNAYPTALSVTTNGGAGGNTFNNIFSSFCHGPGGGGGGGVLWVTQAALPPNVTHTTTGGAAGQVTNPSQPCFNTTFQATNGSAGSSIFNLSPPAGSVNPNLGPDIDICDGATATLNPGVFTSYTWSDGSVNPTLDVTVSGQYEVTVTGSCGSGADTILVTVNPNPVPALGNDTSYCDSFPLVLNPGAFANYLWQDASSNSTYTVTSSGQYEVTVTDANGCQGADTIDITVFPLPTVNLGPDFSICANSSATLDAGPGFSAYLWQNASTAQTLTANTAGAYSVTATDANGCQDADTLNLGIFPLPTPNLGPDFDICQGQSANLDAGPGYAAYLWQDGSTNQTFTATASGTYSVTVTDANGCEGIDDMVLTVNPNPIADLGPDVQICVGQNHTWIGGFGFSSYLWQDGSTNQTLVASTPGTYSVTVTDANGCQATDDADLIVNPNPSPSLGANFLLCAGAVPITPTGGPYSGYVWQDGSTNSSYTVTGPGTYVVTVTDANGCIGVDQVIVTPGSASVSLGNDTVICQGDSLILFAGWGFSAYDWWNGPGGVVNTANAVGTYWVTVTDPLGCEASDTMRITGLRPYPAPNLGRDTALCVGTSLLLDAGPGDSYQWSNGATTQTQTLQAIPGIYQVTVTNQPGCSTVENINILDVYPQPTASPGNDARICAGDSVIFDAENSFPATYVWSTGQTGPAITAFESGTFTVTVTNICGSAVGDATIEPLLYPPVPDIGPDTSICEEDIRFDAGVNADAYLWNNTVPGYFYSVFHPGVFWVTATNQCGSGTDTIRVVEECEPALYFPSGFTPNGDLLNDEFGPVGEAVEAYEMSIFDRWGKLIFQSNNQNDWWDGSFGGQPAQEGVYVWKAFYYYTFRGERKEYNRQGSITLIR